MEKFYIILDSLPGLAGLHIRGEPHTFLSTTHATTGLKTVRVSEIITNAVVGDRDVKYPVPPNSLWITENHLREVEDTTHEYSNDNDYGKFQFEGRIIQGKLDIAYAQYENAISVTIMDKSIEPAATLYSKTFYKNQDHVMDVLVGVMMGANDPDDIVFAFKDLSWQEEQS